MAKQAGFAQRATIKYGGGLESTQAAANFANSYSNSLTSIEARDARQKKVFDDVTGAYQAKRDRLDKIPETQNLSLNNNVNSFLSKGADQIHEITNQMNNGMMSQADGTKYIAQITGYVDQYEKLAPSLIAQAQFGLEAIANGTASKQNSGDLQKLLMNVGDNKGNITLDEKDGVMYLKDLETGYSLNLQEFERIASEDGSSIIATIPNLSGDEGIGIDEEFDAIKDIVGLYTDVDETRNGQIITTRKYDKATVIKEMTRAGSFENLWKNEDAASIWYDLMHPNDKITRFGEKDKTYDVMGVEIQDKDAPDKFDPSNPEQRKAIQQWAIEQSVDRNIPNDQEMTTRSDGSREAWEKDNQNSNNWSAASTDAKPVYDIINNIYSQINAVDPATDELITKPEDFADIVSKLNGLNGGLTVEVNDDGFFEIYSKISGSGDNRGRDMISDGDFRNPSDIMKLYNEFKVTPHLDDYGMDKNAIEAKLEEGVSPDNIEARNNAKISKTAIAELEGGINSINGGDPDNASTKQIMRYLSSLNDPSLGEVKKLDFVGGKVGAKGAVAIGNYKINFPKNKTWKEDLFEHLSKADKRIIIKY